tara:strand:+ start:230 stop:3559 length:3330 start_codon:yes stop_codon:yes gene_type:complete
MARINTYSTDATVQKNDKLLGSNADGTTRNFSVKDIGTFQASINAGGVIGQLPYVYHNSGFGGSSARQNGSITIYTLNESTAFNAVTTIKVSKFPNGYENDAVAVINAFLNKEIIIASQDTPNNFGIFTCTAVAQDSSETDFYDLALTFNSGNGSFVNKDFYSAARYIGSDLNTTYDLNVPSGTTSIRLTGSDSTTDNVAITGSGGVTVSRTNANAINIEAAAEQYTGTVTGTGTTNYLSKFTGSSAIGDSLVFDNGTNVGIGTTAPAYKLQVAGDIAVGQNDGFYVNNTNVGIERNANDLILGGFGGIIFKSSATNVSNQTERMRINSSGNVGIGTSSPGKTLDVAGRGRFIDSTSTVDILSSTYVPLLISNTGGYAHARINGFEVGGNTTATNEGYIKTSDNSRRLSLDTNGWRFVSTNTEMMRLTSAGDLGIGTTSPGAKLDVKGGDSFDGLRITDSGGGDGFKVTSHTTQGTYVQLYNATHLPTIILDARTDSTSRHTYFNGGGNVGIGTTNPNAKLHIEGGVLKVKGDNSTDGTAIFVANSAKGTNQSHIHYGTTGDWYIRSSSASGKVILQDSGGNVGIGTTSPGRKLEVAGDVGINGYIYHNGDDSRIGFEGNDAIRMYTANSVRLQINSNGNVGIGTTSPSEKLHIVGNVQIDSGLIELYSLNSGTFIGDGSTGNITTATGDRNVAIGQASFRSATDARYNTTVGHASMQDTTTGDYNSAFGNQALKKNISGNQNVAIGNQSLNFATASSSNTAVGYRALYKTQTNQNVAVGNSALVNLESSTNSGQNTAVGVSALGRITSGQRNIGIGFEAGRKYGGTNNENTTSNDSVFIGNNTDPAGDDQTNQIVIGYNAIGLGSNTVVLGNDSIVTTQLKGNVGIGTTSPSTKFHLQGGIARFSNVSSNYLEIDGSNSTNNNAVISNRFNQLQLATNAGAGAPHIALLPGTGGNVGIGTTSPAEKLDVVGYAKASTGFKVGSYGLVYESSNNLNIKNSAYYHTIFYTNNAERMRITNAGNVGIGTTSPTEKLEVNGTVKSSGLHVTAAPRIDSGGSSPSVAPSGQSQGPTQAQVKSGGNADYYLSEPDEWLVVNISGTDYVIPAYEA